MADAGVIFLASGPGVLDIILKLISVSKTNASVIKILTTGLNRTPRYTLADMLL